jgi:hypothetical protein
VVSSRAGLISLITVGLLLAGCSDGTSVMVKVAATSGPAPEDMLLSVALNAPPRTKKMAITTLPAEVLVLVPDGVERVTATLTGSAAGVAFTKTGSVQTVAHQQRTIQINLDNEGGPDLAPPSDLAPAPDLGGDDLAKPPLALGNAVPLTLQMGQVSTTVDVGLERLLVLAVYWNWNMATISVSDSVGNDWKMAPVYSNPVTTCANSNGAQVQIWYAENVKRGKTTVTAVETPGMNPFGAFLLVYSGVALENALEAESGAAANMASNAMAVPSLTTTHDNDLLVAVFEDVKHSGTMVPGEGFRADIIDSSAYSMIEDNIGVARGVHAIGGNLPSGVSDTCWVGAAAAFRSR